MAFIVVITLCSKLASKKAVVRGLQSRALRRVWTLWQTTIMKLERMQRISNTCRTTIGEELKEGPRKLVLRLVRLSQIYVV